MCLSFSWRSAMKSTCFTSSERSASRSSGFLHLFYMNWRHSPLKFEHMKEKPERRKQNKRPHKRAKKEIPHGCRWAGSLRNRQIRWQNIRELRNAPCSQKGNSFHDNQDASPPVASEKQGCDRCDTNQHGDCDSPQSMIQHPLPEQWSLVGGEVESYQSQKRGYSSCNKGTYPKSVHQLFIVDTF